MTKSTLRLVLALAALFAQVPVSARGDEWPGLYFDHCGRCHGNADALFERRAALRGNKIVGRRSGRDLRVFLGSHFARRTEAEIETIYMELLRVARGQGRFQQQCAICHVSAEQLARGSLMLRDGALFGRYSGRQIEDFLKGHGRLDKPADVVFFVEVLRRNLPAERQ